MHDIKRSLQQFFPQFEERLINELCEYGKFKQFKGGEPAIRTGELMQYTMLVTRGRLKLYTEGENGEEFFMYYLEPGQACALSFVCAARNRKSDVEAFAVEDSEVVLIPIARMDSLMVNYKSWYYFVIETYRSRYEELLDVIRNVAFNNMDERLSYYLAKQKNAFGSNTLNITHEQIANDLNTSRVVISRLLKQMEQQGALKLHRNLIELT
jgi:CRP/FNR family transcriptional regulator